MFYFKLLIATVLAIAAWLATVFFTAFYGWWMSAIAEPGNTEQFYQAVSVMLEEENPGNAGLVLISAGEVSHRYFSTGADDIGPDTVFATASMSKWLAAFAVMKLVEDGQLDLDKPVDDYLTRWQLPAGDFDNSLVTARRLLSHTAGLSDGLGFGDYLPDEELPSLEESLSNPRASSDREISMAVSSEPGTEWQYSGGSYLLLELLVEEVSGQSFDSYMRDSFFEPLGMDHSGYDYLGSFADNAGSYDPNGQAATVFKYASKAATAFVTSSADLSSFVLSQIPASGLDNPLSQDTIRAMREPHGRTSGVDIWGLGTILYSPTGSDDFVYGHDGGNEPAINTVARINPQIGDAIIVLLTGHPSLATRIGSEWVLWQTGYPDVLDLDAVFDSMTLPILIGSLLILLLALYVAYRHYRRQHSSALT
ncbi:MAG: beta-lactamase family protein [Pseudomonadales bacterium]|nr:beta-lactamase family protein [Pseudomonadales bacterium]